MQRSKFKLIIINLGFITGILFFLTGFKSPVEKKLQSERVGICNVAAKSGYQGTITSEKDMGLVTLSVINIRKEPGQASELVSQ